MTKTPTLEATAKIDWKRSYYAEADLSDELRKQCEAQAAQIANFKTVMIAAAEEISAHWDSHCDAEGYGPSNLLHRLEQGIPSQYGYTAGAFAKLKAERDALAAQIEALRADAERGRRLLRSIARAMRAVQLRPSYAVDWSEMLKTIDAAMAAKEPR